MPSLIHGSAPALIDGIIGTAVEAAIGRLFFLSTSNPGQHSSAAYDLIRITTGVLKASEQWCREQDAIAVAKDAVLRKGQLPDRTKPSSSGATAAKR